MRVLLEILLIGLLGFVGWRQPFRDVVRTRFPQTEIKPSRLATETKRMQYEAEQARSTRRFNPSSARPNGSWMYEERGALDAKPTR